MPILHTSSWASPVARPSVPGCLLKITRVCPGPSSLTGSVIALVSRLISPLVSEAATERDRKREGEMGELDRFPGERKGG